MITPDFNTPINGGGETSRVWMDFFYALHVALDGIRETKTVKATLDFGSIAAGATANEDVTVSGARANDIVTVGLPASIDDGISWAWHVSANDTVTIKATNTTGGAIDPASAIYRVMVTMI